MRYYVAKLESGLGVITSINFNKQCRNVEKDDEVIIFKKDVRTILAIIPIERLICVTSVEEDDGCKAM